ncbi:MAG: tetratricopeptide repeat protein [Chitinophagaceae bacterium]|jgi:signal transduction histidine kinase|nr:tetratricopeptide repeat protein [Chitinophagaceae bacterium]
MKIKIQFIPLPKVMLVVIGRLWVVVGKSFILLAFALLILEKGNARLTSNNIDSALAALATAKADTNKVILLRQLGNYYQDNDANAAKKYVSQSGELSKALNYKDGMYAYLNDYTFLMIRQSLYDSALYYAKQMQAMAVKENNIKPLAIAELNIGISYGGKEQYDTAMQYFLKALNYAEQAKDNNTIAKCYNTLLATCLSIGQFEKAIQYGEKALELARQYQPAAITIPMTNLALAYTNMQQYDKAGHLLENVLSIRKKSHNEYGELSASINLMGVYFKNDIKKPQLKELIDRTLFLANKLDDKESLAEGFYYAGFYALLRQQYDKARTYADSSLAVLPATNKALKKDNYTLLSKIAYAGHDFERGIYYDRKADSLQNEMNTTEVNRNVVEMQAKYEATQRENEITLLKKDRELNHATVQKQRALIIAGIIGVLLLIFITVLLINRYRTNAKAKRLLELEKMRTSIARDLHDEMGSTLSGINIISKVGVNNINTEPAKAREYLQKIHEYSGTVLESISDIAWTINPTNDSMEKIIFKMQEFAADVFEPLNITYEFEIEGNLQNLPVELQTRKNICLIFKEAVNNAAKYSQCTQVNISVKVSENALRLQIKDNGIGFSRNGINRENGLKNMEARAAQIGGTLSIASVPKEGTTVRFQIKT